MRQPSLPNTPLLTELHLSVGAADTRAVQKVPVGDVTVFVGPNNSGKSLLLRELKSLITNGDSSPRLLLQNCSFDPSLTVERSLELVSGQLIASQQTTLGKEMIYQTADWDRQVQYNEAHLEAMYARDPQNALRHSIGNLSTVLLSGEARLHIADPERMPDLLAPASGPISFLFLNDSHRAEVRIKTMAALGSYLTIDATKMGHLRMRLSKISPSESVERSWSNDAVNYHANSQEVAEQSDGTKAYIGTLLAAYNPLARILLIDEPEAFLHPPLARLLARQVCARVGERRSNLVVATHSSHFVAGCLESGANVTIVRMTYSEAFGAQARVLSSSLVRRIMTNPLLRTTGLMEALFYDSVVVSEGDTDRSMYDEIDRILDLEQTPTKTKSCLHLCAHGYHMVDQIAEPLREIGIPTAMILDLDAIRKGGQTFSDLLRAAGASPARIHSLTTLRGDIVRSFEEAQGDWRALKKKGLPLLPDDMRCDCEELLKQLSELGLFLVPVGELEGWLSKIAPEGQKGDWLLSAFERMRPDLIAEKYGSPPGGDIWEFIRSVKSWLRGQLEQARHSESVQ